VSLPTGERGLKYNAWCYAAGNASVAPHGGAWIEIEADMITFTALKVAPHGGAWIEIDKKP